MFSCSVGVDTCEGALLETGEGVGEEEVSLAGCLKRPSLLPGGWVSLLLESGSLGTAVPSPASPVD